LNTPTSLTIRLMFNRDLARVLEIERRSPGEHWTRKDFLPVFHAADTDGWVAEADGRIVGFMIFQVQNAGGSRLVVLRNIAVAPYWRRSGVGRAMLERLDEKLRGAEDRIQAVVAESNLPAQLFLRAAGYKAVRVLRGHFGSEDGYLMERRLE
jgi:ribosomal-protein-alanine N-acetyltransferase